MAAVSVGSLMTQRYRQLTRTSSCELVQTLSAQFEGLVDISTSVNSETRPLTTMPDDVTGTLNGGSPALESRINEAVHTQDMT